MSKENSMDPAEDAEMNPTDVQNNKPDGPNRNSILKEIVERYLENNKESE
ncbi:Hypothetical predicted protein [Paramuricea clavata]|uniref:Uncharacterized protein n=1 Tax=Paramuricea clavata TaxID=317549 RepID=A0A6S7IE60_PARCT|nr:Hypothetical predicted protein [Paramuricea clavata]